MFKNLPFLELFDPENFDKIGNLKTLLKDTNLKKVVDLFDKILQYNSLESCDINTRKYHDTISNQSYL